MKQYKLDTLRFKTAALEHIASLPKEVQREEYEKLCAGDETVITAIQMKMRV